MDVDAMEDEAVVAIARAADGVATMPAEADHPPKDAANDRATEHDPMPEASDETTGRALTDRATRDRATRDRATIDSNRAKARNLSIVTDVLAGAALLAGGVSLYLTLRAPDKERPDKGPEKRGVAMRVSPRADGGWINVATSF